MRRRYTWITGTKGRAKKKPETEIVSRCDFCGMPLGRSCARTGGSSICAIFSGVATRFLKGTYHFFCDDSCANQFRDSGLGVRDSQLATRP